MQRALLKALSMSIPIGLLLASGVNASAQSPEPQVSAGCPTTPPSSSFVSVIDFGAIPNDGLDDTMAIQNALDANADIWVPVGNYSITNGVNPVGGLNPNNGQHLAMHCNAVLNAAAVNWGQLGIIDIVSKTNVTIEGGVVDGQRNANPNGLAYGLRVRGNDTDILVSATTVRNVPANQPGGGLAGDGINIGPAQGALPSDVTLDDVVSTGNDRNGLSVVGGSNILVTGGSYSNQIGAAPGSGIDLEPTAGAIGISDVPVHDVTIQNALISNNGGPGIKIQNPEAPPEDVTVINNDIRFNLQVEEQGSAVPVDGIFTFGRNVEIAGNEFRVGRRDGIQVRFDAGITSIHDNLFIGVPDPNLPPVQDARWALFRTTGGLTSPEIPTCIWNNQFQGEWTQGHYPNNAGWWLEVGPC